jgi:hypothetical protein
MGEPHLTRQLVTIAARDQPHRSAKLVTSLLGAWANAETAWPDDFGEDRRQEAGIRMDS